MNEKFADISSVDDAEYLFARRLGDIPNYGSASVLREIDDIYRLKSDVIQSKSLISELKTWYRKLDIKLIPIWCDAYPSRLREIPYPPAILFLMGEARYLSDGFQHITLVGSRSVGRYGYQLLNLMFDTFSSREKKNVSVVSGLAYGIDAYSHRYALDSDVSTVAVVAGGLDKGYPSGNQHLYNRIVSSGMGAIISEFPPGKEIVRGMFPMRNRIMAGIAQKCVVVQASLDSGSLVTASYCAEYNREIASFPANITEPAYLGNNKLISEGATVLTCVQDIDTFIGI